jgi:hypothetical protein
VDADDRTRAAQARPGGDRDQRASARRPLRRDQRRRGLRARAQDDGHTIVTDNIADYECTRREWESRGQTRHGLVYALNPPFNRHRGERVIGQMVKALAHFLASPDATKEPFNRAHYLREAPGPD